jgi:ammonium transporter, Amt family
LPTGSGRTGWLGTLGAIDFAGGEVIHIASGFSALAAAMVLGKRYDASEPMKPSNVPMVMFGAALLWFGWFGFNAGSAGGASGLASHAFFNTQLAAATAGLMWILLEKLTGGQPTAAGLASGIVVGLVAITPGCGFVHIYAAFLFGVLATPVCFFAQKFKSKIGIDDTLDAWALHGVGGIMGSLLTGLFATKDVNFATGGFYYGEKLFGLQLLGVTISASFSFFGTLIIMLALKYTIGVRIADDMEKAGIDVSEHGGNKNL